MTNLEQAAKFGEQCANAMNKRDTGLYNFLYNNFQKMYAFCGIEGNASIVEAFNTAYKENRIVR